VVKLAYLSVAPPPDELNLKLDSYGLGSRMDEHWLWMIGSGREDGFAMFISESGAELPLLYRNFPSALRSAETGRYDYFDRADLSLVLTPPTGYRLFATFHGHPWGTGYNFIKRFPYFIYDPTGPSIPDYGMSRAYPGAYHIVRWRQAGMTVTGYYGPRVESELSD
jgi:hypothetical protein